GTRQALPCLSRLRAWTRHGATLFSPIGHAAVATRTTYPLVHHRLGTSRTSARLRRNRGKVPRTVHVPSAQIPAHMKGTHTFHPLGIQRVCRGSVHQNPLTGSETDLYLGRLCTSHHQ